jgi:hypothetical protein
MTQLRLSEPTQPFYKLSEVLDRWCNIDLGMPTICRIGSSINTGKLRCWQNTSIPSGLYKQSGEHAGNQSQTGLFQIKKCSYGHDPDNNDPLSLSSIWLSVDELIDPLTLNQISNSEINVPAELSTIFIKLVDLLDAEEELNIRYSNDLNLIETDTTAEIKRTNKHSNSVNRQNNEATTELSDRQESTLLKLIGVLTKALAEESGNKFGTPERPNLNQIYEHKISRHIPESSSRGLSRSSFYEHVQRALDEVKE